MDRFQLNKIFWLHKLTFCTLQQPAFYYHLSQEQWFCYILFLIISFEIARKLYQLKSIPLWFFGLGLNKSFFLLTLQNLLVNLLIDICDLLENLELCFILTLTLQHLIWNFLSHLMTDNQYTQLFYGLDQSYFNLETLVFEPKFNK